MEKVKDYCNKFGDNQSYLFAWSRNNLVIIWFILETVVWWNQLLMCRIKESIEYAKPLISTV